MQLVDIHSNVLDIAKYSGVTDNSKEVVAGGIFVAVRGHLHDGHDYISEALKRGASLIVIDKIRANLASSISRASVSVVDDARTALSYIASRMYRKPENIIAITGTNGKTSVIYFFQQLLFRLGLDAASIGTLGVVRKNEIRLDMGLEGTSPLTTLGSLQMHKVLHRLVDEDIKYAALEASSHGLVQHRLDYIPFKGAAFTSFSRDHLDYHQDMESYLKAKTYLFERLLTPGSFALINSEMEIAESLVSVCKAKRIETLTYGHAGDFLKIKSIKHSENNSFIVHFFLNGQLHQFSCNLLGHFQTYNILCTLGILVSLGFEIERLLPLLKELSSVPGRMQRVEKSNVYVDYAHTPDALSSALKSMKEFMEHMETSGRIIVVFGCGGERDQGKRFEMGKISHSLADEVIVTDDNPRNESASEIRAEIVKGCPTAIEIPDREQAIKYVIQHSKSEDLILIAGKGHEKFQIFANQKSEFDDVAMAKKYMV